MERNKDPDVIIMDRRVYDTLIHYANIGVSEAGGDLDSEKCHIRKFNPVVGAEHRKQLDDAKELDKKHRRLAVVLLNSHAGEKVFVQRDPTMIAEVELLRINQKDPTFVFVKDPITSRHEQQVHIQRVMTELPEGYRLHRIGKYEGRYIHNDRTVGN